MVQSQARLALQPSVLVQVDLVGIHSHRLHADSMPAIFYCHDGFSCPAPHVLIRLWHQTPASFAVACCIIDPNKNAVHLPCCVQVMVLLA